MSPQVTLLSMGHLMYFGPREDLVNWFTDGCGYPYDPKMHGLASDWVMDLVNIGFKKPEVCMCPSQPAYCACVATSLPELPAGDLEVS